jgi:hypothetical protein
MNGSKRRLLFAAVAGLALGAASARAGETSAAASPPSAPTAAAADAEICPDTSVEDAKRDAALRDLGERLTALPPPPSGYRVLNRTGLNYGSRRPAPATSPPPPAAPAKLAP